jgi:hypothetical protein
MEFARKGWAEAGKLRHLCSDAKKATAIVLRRETERAA